MITGRNRIFLIIMLGALNTITPFSIDMYLPGFPDMAADFNTTIARIALSVSTYFLGFALGQLLYGPLLDRFGRKKPLYVGLILYIFSSLACIAFHSVESLWVARFFQALTGCVGAVAAMAMVRDFFPVQESAKIISLLVLILGVSPMLAPTIGSAVVVAFGWRWVFVILAAIVFLMLVVIYLFLPEGHPADSSVSLRPAAILRGFREVLIHPKFYVYAITGSFSFAGLFAYVAGSPAIFMDGFHVSAKMYGAIFAFLSIGIIGGSQLTHVFSRYWPAEKILRVCLVMQVLSGLIFVAGTLAGWYGLGATVACLLMLLSCSGVIYPSAAALALSPFSKNAGTAAAMFGFLQIGIGGLISASPALLPMSGSQATAVIMLGSSLVAFVALFLSGRYQHLNKPALSKDA